MDHTSFVPRHVLITRLSAIGDCIATIPLAVDVKRLWPECSITWIVDCGAAALLEPHASVDRVIRIGKKWLQHPGQWGALRSTLKSQRFELVLDPQGLTKSALLGWLSGASVRIGFDSSHARELAPWLATERVTRTARHMVDTYRQLLEPWRETAAGAGEFCMPVYSAAAASLNTKLSALGLPPEWLCINVGAGWPTKLWPPERFASLGQAIYQNWGLKSLVVWSGESELRAAEQIVAQLGPAGLLAPSTSLPELAELLRRAKLLVSSDTGPAHLAAAIGTPSVVLFGPTWGDECGPYGRQHRVVQSIVMPPRGAPQRTGIAHAMNAIQIDEVLDACEDLLAGMSVQRISA